MSSVNTKSWDVESSPELQKEGFLVNLIRGTFLPECTVLVTSRPSATSELLIICHPQIQKRIEVLGFTQESVEEYATSIFSSEPEILQRFKAFISASKNPAINSLIKSDHLLPCTLTQVYTQLCLTILKRYLQSNYPSVALVNKFKDLPDHLYQEFLKLSEIAFEGLRRQEVIFHSLPSDLVHFGFLDAVSSLYGGGSVSYNFLHLTLQEFFAAYHISHLSDDARPALLEECGSDECWHVVWRFVAGLTEFKFFKGHSNSYLFVRDEGEDEIKVKPLLVQCLFEAHNINLKRSESFGLKYIRNSGFNLTPLDWYALGYCIANFTSKVTWNIIVDYSCHIESLVSGLKTSSTTSNNSNINRLQSYYSPGVLPYLEYFPLRGITDLILTRSSSDLLVKLLPSMTSLKRLSTHFPDAQCVDKFLQHLPQTNVTSLSIEDTDLTESTSALQPLIDPVTGTLKELCISRHDNSSLLDMVCALSSLKSLKLGYLQHVSSLIQLQTNTCLTKLEIKYDRDFPHEAIEVIIGILEHNKTLEVFTVGDFAMPQDFDVLRDIVEALCRNSTVRKFTIGTYYTIIRRDHEDSKCEADRCEVKRDDWHLQQLCCLHSGAEQDERNDVYMPDNIQSKYPQLNCDPRIIWQQTCWIN